MNLPRWQPNNVIEAALAHLPIDDCRLSKFASVEKCMDRHDQHKIPHADPHLSVPHLIVRRFINERRQAISHSTRPRANTEQRSIGAFSIRFGNCEIGNDVRCSANDMFDAPSAA